MVIESTNTYNQGFVDFLLRNYKSGVVTYGNYNQFYPSVFNYYNSRNYGNSPAYSSQTDELSTEDIMSNYAIFCKKEKQKQKQLAVERQKKEVARREELNKAKRKREQKEKFDESKKCLAEYTEKNGYIDESLLDVTKSAGGFVLFDNLGTLTSARKTFKASQTIKTAIGNNGNYKYFMTKNPMLSERAYKALRDSEKLRQTLKKNSEKDKIIAKEIIKQRNNLLKLIKDGNTPVKDIEQEIIKLEQVNSGVTGPIKSNWRKFRNLFRGKNRPKLDIHKTAPGDILNAESTQKALKKCIGKKAFAKGLFKSFKGFAIVSLFCEIGNIIDAYKRGGIDVAKKQLGKSVLKTGLNSLGYTVGNAAGRWAGAALGAKIGASIGTVCPGLGNIIGGVLGALIGCLVAWGADKLTKCICKTTETAKLDAQEILSDDNVAAQKANEFLAKYESGEIKADKVDPKTIDSALFIKNTFRQQELATEISQLTPEQIEQIQNMTPEQYNALSPEEQEQVRTILLMQNQTTQAE
ncbi:MAG: hypothetical protein MJ237_04310 [bacterium]|nr:hypothetical protein [bacterium]